MSTSDFIGQVLPHGPSQPGSSASLTFLRSDDELVLVKLYITKIPQLCGHFRFPEEVEATAISYLKRFYLKNTVMDWHPKNVMRVSAVVHSSSVFNVFGQAYCTVSGNKNNQQPYFSGFLHI